MVVITADSQFMCLCSIHQRGLLATLLFSENLCLKSMGREERGGGGVRGVITSDKILKREGSNLLSSFHGQLQIFPREKLSSGETFIEESDKTFLKHRHFSKCFSTKHLILWGKKIPCRFSKYIFI